MVMINGVTKRYNLSYSPDIMLCYSPNGDMTSAFDELCREGRIQKLCLKQMTNGTSFYKPFFLTKWNVTSKLAQQ